MKTYIVDVHYTNGLANLRSINSRSYGYEINYELFLNFSTQVFTKIADIIESEFGKESILSRNLAVFKLTEEQISYLLLKYS